MNENRNDGTDTRLVHLSSGDEGLFGFVNPPVHRGSTALYPSMKALEESEKDPFKRSFPTYGRFGTPSARAFESAMCELEGGHAAICTNSGLSAITTAILSFAQAGDHLLVSDSVYYPTRGFCDSLKRLGVETEYYDPCVAGGIRKLFRPNTRLVFMESPGSLTFEIQDIPAITEACRAQGIISLVDNTWATPLFLQPLRLGADISIHSATKFISGHSDSFLGVIVCNEATYPAVRGTGLRLGQAAGPDDIYFGLRGLRTLGLRMRQHESQGLALARWLSERPEVATVLHPGLPSHPGHDLWQRDFRGAAGVFSFALQPHHTKEQVHALVDRLRLFGIGFSYGGFESLVIPLNPPSQRLPGNWQKHLPLIRLHVGLENAADLQADLEQGFKGLLT